MKKPKQGQKHDTTSACKVGDWMDAVQFVAEVVPMSTPFYQIDGVPHCDVYGSKVGKPMVFKREANRFVRME